MWFWHQSVPKIRVYFRKLSKHQLRRCKNHSARIWILIFTLNIQVWIWGHFLTWTWTVFRCINSPSNLGLCSLGAPDVLLQFPWVETRSTNGCSRAVCWKSSHFETCKLVWVVFSGPRCGLPSAPASRFWKEPRAKPKVMHGYVWGSRIPVFRCDIISLFFMGHVSYQLPVKSKMQLYPHYFPTFPETSFDK